MAYMTKFFSMIKNLIISEIKFFFSPLNILVFAVGYYWSSNQSLSIVQTFLLFFHTYFFFKIEIWLLVTCCVILITGWNWVEQFFAKGENISLKWNIFYLFFFGYWNLYEWDDYVAIQLADFFFNMELYQTEHIASAINTLNKFFTFDSYCIVLRYWILACVSSLFVVIPGKYIQKHFTWDTGLLVLLMTSFLTLIATSNNFFTFYVLLEGINLALIALIALRRFNIWSLEAALKYFVLNGLINGLILFSLVLMYYQTNSLNFVDIKYYLISNPNYNWAVVLFIIAFLFKLSVWPLHTWTPDVYEGAATWVLFYMALVIKSTLFALFIRFLFYTFFPVLDSLKPLLYTTGIGSIVIGTFGSLWQKSLKRFLAYSTITNSGLCLVTLIAYDSVSFFNIGIVFFHLFFYFITTFLTFAFYFQLIKNNSKRMYFFSDYFSFKYQKSVMTNIFIFLFLNAIVMMASLPPAITFYSKFMLLYCLMQQNYCLTTLTILLLNCLMSYYYLRLIKIFYFEDPKKEIYNVILFSSESKPNYNIQDSSYKTTFGFLIMLIINFQWLLTYNIDAFIFMFVKYAKLSFAYL